VPVNVPDVDDDAALSYFKRRGFCYLENLWEESGYNYGMNDTRMMNSKK
jgi:hypothetical protein